MAAQKVILFEEKTPTISRSVYAYFNDKFLVIEGCDLGSFVKGALGDSDYEYFLHIPKEGLPEFYQKLECNPKGEIEALDFIKKKFEGRECFANIKNYLEEHQVEFKFGSWR